MKKLMVYFVFSSMFICLNAQHDGFYAPNSFDPENFCVDPLSSMASWEASGDTTAQPIKYKLFLSDTLYAEVPGDEFSFHFACLTYGQEYIAGIQAVYDWTVSDTVDFSWSSTYLPTVQEPFVSYSPGWSNVTFTLQTITDCNTTMFYPDGLVSFNLYRDGITIANVPFDPGSTNWGVFISDSLYPGTYIFCASALYVLDTFGFPGGIGESDRVCDTIQITWVGVENQTSPDIVEIFPNPTNGKTTISSASKISEIAVFDYLGTRVLFVDGMHSQKETLDISMLSPGIYIVKTTTVKGAVNKRIVKM